MTSRGIGVLACALLLFGPASALADKALCPCSSGADFGSCAKTQLTCSSRRTAPDGHDAFRLRIDFPEAPVEEPNRPWEAFDYRSDWQGYMRAVLAYVLEGNEQVDFDLAKNTTRAWYHAPWLQREPLRGLTSERSSRSRELHPKQNQLHRNWAVSFYNAPGGYTIGKVWRDPGAPDSADVAFAEGTVSAKLLFTTADADEVPYLARSKAWYAAIDPGGPVVRMRLLQLDIAVRDSRFANPTGWIFGTFIHHCGGSESCAGLRGLTPLSIAWGNDPGYRRDDYEAKKPLAESRINETIWKELESPDRPELGYLGRANGPVDHPGSACLACHSHAMDNQGHEPPAFVAEYPGTEKRLAHHFRNLATKDLFCEEAVEGNCSGRRPLDYSLQLSVGIDRFRLWKKEWCVQNQDAPECPAEEGLEAVEAPVSPFRFSRGETESLEVPIPARQQVVLAVTGAGGTRYLTRGDLDAAPRVSSAAGAVEGADLAVLLARHAIAVGGASQLTFFGGDDETGTLTGTELRSGKTFLVESSDPAKGWTGFVESGGTVRELVKGVSRIDVRAAP